jgi:hypothetical protein
MVLIKPGWFACAKEVNAGVGQLGAQSPARRRPIADQRRARDCPPYLLQRPFLPCGECAPEIRQRQSVFTIPSAVSWIDSKAWFQVS